MSDEIQSKSDLSFLFKSDYFKNADDHVKQEILAFAMELEAEKLKSLYD